MFQKLLLKSPLLRKVYRAVFPQETTGDVVAASTARFDAIEAEQDAIAKEQWDKAQKADRLSKDAKAKRDAAAKASRNFRNMLEAD
ncbi:hypothetical protein [Vibrio phage VCPH]|nr:hypothetical protein [Vibrio phage VCPH]